MFSLSSPFLTLSSTSSFLGTRQSIPIDLFLSYVSLFAAMGFSTQAPLMIRETLLGLRLRRASPSFGRMT